MFVIALFSSKEQPPHKNTTTAPGKGNLRKVQRHTQMC